MLNAEYVFVNYNNILTGIVFVKQNAFPPQWDYGDTIDYYTNKFRFKENINIVLKDDEKIAGHLLAIPHNDAVLELKNDDSLMHNDALRYYIETFAILPEYRGRKGLSLMLEALKDELKKRGIYNISLHARISNNFSSMIQNKLKITAVRRIEKWRYYNFTEPTDYIEAQIA